MPNKKLIVISGPSGSGKTTVCTELLKKMPGIVRSISFTTRAPRNGEKNGIDYFFITPEEFEKKVEEEKFLEYADVFGQYYGTDKDWVLSQEEDVLLCIDVQGAAQVRKNMPEAVLIFLMPPSKRELERRLRSRATDDDAEIDKRLSIAEEEMARSSEYDYTVINDEVEGSVSEMKKIIEQARK